MRQTALRALKLDCNGWLLNAHFYFKLQNICDHSTYINKHFNYLIIKLQKLFYILHPKIQSLMSPKNKAI